MESEHREFTRLSEFELDRTSIVMSTRLEHEEESIFSLPGVTMSTRLDNEDEEDMSLPDPERHFVRRTRSEEEQNSSTSDP